MVWIRHFLRNLILTSCLACVIGRVLHAKKTKVKSRKNKQWLVDSVSETRGCYAPVICTHGPQPRGIAGTFTFRPAILCYNPHTAG